MPDLRVFTFQGNDRQKSGNEEIKYLEIVTETNEESNR